MVHAVFSIITGSDEYIFCEQKNSQDSAYKQATSLLALGWEGIAQAKDWRIIITHWCFAIENGDRKSARVSTAMHNGD